ncbi:MAG: AAA family ATPase [Thermodesulfobacteriota bacterium]
MDDAIIANRYKLSEKIGFDCMTDNYRALDLTTNSRVTLRIFRAAAKRLSLISQLRFKREVEAVSKLHHENILRVYGLGEYENSFYLVTEAFAGRPLPRPSGPLEMDEAVALIKQIASGLEYCHQHGIVHHYLNPDSILVAASAGLAEPGSRPALKITGLGYHWLFDPGRIREAAEIRRVFGYMSPEVSGILRAQPDSRADIYSLGILFYELLCGMLPYTGPDLSTLIHQHIAQRPQPLIAVNNAVPQVLDQIVLRLIAKEPQDRYQSLAALIADLREFQHQRRQGIAAIDFVIARQDQLQSLTYVAPLVGRNRELAVLRAHLAGTASSRGNLCLVYGEPGIGKSSLVDALRGQVHGAGALFITGKCNQYELQKPYGVFSRALRAYVERLERRSSEDREMLVGRIRKSLGDLAGEALKIAPEMKRLLGEANGLVELDAEKQRTRFLITATNLLLNLGTPRIPVVIFLDDLQWADRGSIELLERVAERIDTYPILLIAGFRDAEVKADHPLHQALARLRAGKAAVTELPLPGITLRDTGEMLSRMLFEDEESVAELAADLHGRTAGNPFFLIELLHAYVNQGIVFIKDNHYRFEVSRARQAVIPADIVDMVLKRNDLSDQDRDILSYAALIGRKIDFEMLKGVSPFAPQDILTVIEEGITRQFMAGDTTENGDIFFAHDRIREAFYNRLPEDERVSLHARLAHYIEQTRQDNLEPFFYELAHHFSLAGMEEKTLFYALRAGKKAQAAFANDQAIQFYGQAKTILERRGAIAADEYVNLLENLGSVYKTAGRFDEAVQTLTRCESLVPKGEMIRKARILSIIGDTEQSRGDLNRCIEVNKQALKLLGVKLPGNIFTTVLGILQQLCFQGLHSLFPSVFVRQEYSNDPRAAIITNIFYRFLFVYYFTDLITCVYVAYRGFNIARRTLGPCRLTAKYYSTISMIWSQITWRSLGRKDNEVAQKMAEELHDRGALGIACFYRNMIERPVDPAEAIQYARKAVDNLKGVGEFWDLSAALVFVGWNDLMLGGHLDRQLSLAEECIAVGKAINAPQNIGFGLGFKGQLLSLIGGEGLKNDAVAILEEAISNFKKVGDKPWTLLATAYLAYAHLRLNNYAQALPLAEWCNKRFWTHNNLAWWTLDFLGMCAEVCFQTMAGKPDLTEAEKASCLKTAKSLCRKASWYGRLSPTYRGWARQINGTYQWITGQKEKAIKSWDEGIQFVRDHTRDTYRLARILSEKSAWLLQDNPDDARAREYLIEARELFCRLGAKLDGQRVDHLLGLDAADAEALDARQTLTLTRQLDSLLSVTRAIGSVFELEELLDKIVDQALTLTGAERGFLFLYDEGGVLRNKAARGGDAKGSAPFSFAGAGISLGLIQQVESIQQGLIRRRDDRAPAETSSELEEYGIKEALCVPLKAQEKPLGIVYLDNRLAGRVFGRNELTLMNSLAVQASISIQNACLVRDLMEKERSLQEMIEQAADAVTVYDFEGRIQNVNQQTCASLGYSREELLRLMIGAIKPDFGDGQRQSLLENLRSGPLTLSAVHRRKDGSTFPVEERMSIIDYRGRKAVLALVRDITERKKSEEEMQKIERLESLGVFAGGIAHDFNNLLTAIIGNISLIELYRQKGKDFSELLQAMSRAAHQTTHLTQQLLTFSKGGAPVQKKMPLPELLHESAELALSGSAVRCDFTIPEDLWWARIDEGQINQVFNNIFINAKQAMPEGGIIRISAENTAVGPDDVKERLPEGRYVRVSIRDEGIGIPEKDLNRIFDPYFTTKPRGTGLGLATSFSIMQRHGGKISVESAPGSGSTFFLYLPATDAERQEEKQGEAGVFQGRNRILVMDDQEIIRDVLQALLTQLGYEMEYVRDGKEALELYRNRIASGKRFDAVILDLTIPGGMGGKETVQKLLELDHDARVIVSSGYSNDPVMSAYRQYGFQGVVTKPYEIQALSKVLHAVIQGGSS